MPPRKMRQLTGGETENLTQRYWLLRSIIMDKHSTEEDLYKAKLDIVTKMNEDELVYSYYECRYFPRALRSIRGNADLMKEHLLTEWLDRKYNRGEYNPDAKYARHTELKGKLRNREVNKQYG